MAVILIIISDHQCLWMHNSSRHCEGLHCEGLHRNRSIRRHLHTILLHQIRKRQQLWSFIFSHSLLYDLRVVVGALRVHAVCLGIAYMLQPLKTPGQL